MVLSSKITEFEDNLKELDVAIMRSDSDPEIQRIDSKLVKLSTEIKNLSASTLEEARMQIDFFMRRLAEVDRDAVPSENFETVKLLLDRYLSERNMISSNVPSMDLMLSAEV